MHKKMDKTLLEFNITLIIHFNFMFFALIINKEKCEHLILLVF